MKLQADCIVARSMGPDKKKIRKRKGDTYRLSRYFLFTVTSLRKSNTKFHGKIGGGGPLDPTPKPAHVHSRDTTKTNF